MPTALLETKLYVPRLRRGLVPRPRLRQRLDRGSTSKLTLVSAPAGFGKTTQLAEWLAAGRAAQANERSAAWLSLDQGDSSSLSTGSRSVQRQPMRCDPAGDAGPAAVRTRCLGRYPQDEQRRQLAGCLTP